MVRGQKRGQVGGWGRVPAGCPQGLGSSLVLLYFHEGDTKVLVTQRVDLTPPTQVCLANLSLTPRPFYKFPFTDAPA